MYTYADSCCTGGWGSLEMGRRKKEERKKWLEGEDRSQDGVKGRDLRSLDDLPAPGAAATKPAISVPTIFVNQIVGICIPLLRHLQNKRWGSLFSQLPLQPGLSL